MRFDKSRVMRDAHREWRATRHRPGASFSRCLKAAWAAEKQRVDGPVYYQPDPLRMTPGEALMFAEVGRIVRAGLPMG